MGETYAQTKRRLSRETPLNVQFASKLGPGKETPCSMDRCSECGERICWDMVLGGSLVALNFADRGVHIHQAVEQGEEERRALNRAMVSEGGCLGRYAKNQSRTHKRRSFGREHRGKQKEPTLLLLAQQLKF